MLHGANLELVNAAASTDAYLAICRLLRRHLLLKTQVGKVVAVTMFLNFWLLRHHLKST